MINYITELVTAFAAIAAACAAIFSAIAAEKSLKAEKQVHETTKTQILQRLIDDYSSPKMLYALIMLNDFYRSIYVENIRNELSGLYDIVDIIGQDKEIKKQNEEKIKNILIKFENVYKYKYENEKQEIKYKIKKLEDTIDFQRRFVTSFYNNLALTYDKEDIDIEEMKKRFNLNDLKIIREILIPMEEVHPTLYGEDRRKLNKMDYPPFKLYKELRASNKWNKH